LDDSTSLSPMAVKHASGWISMIRQSVLAALVHLENFRCQRVGLCRHTDIKLFPGCSV
jgi:hypothetical protein